LWTIIATIFHSILSVRLVSILDFVFALPGCDEDRIPSAWTGRSSTRDEVTRGPEFRGSSPWRHELHASTTLAYDARKTNTCIAGKNKKGIEGEAFDKTDYVWARHQARFCENINPVLSDDRPYWVFSPQQAKPIEVCVQTI